MKILMQNRIKIELGINFRTEITLLPMLLVIPLQFPSLSLSRAVLFTYLLKTLIYFLLSSRRGPY